MNLLVMSARPAMVPRVTVAVQNCLVMRVKRPQPIGSPLVRQDMNHDWLVERAVEIPVHHTVYVPAKRPNTDAPTDTREQRQMVKPAAYVFQRVQLDVVVLWLWNTMECRLLARLLY